MAVTESRDIRHRERSDDWALIDRMLTGEDVRSELVRGAYEAKRAYKARRQRADWKPYTRDLISRLTGELFSRAGEVSRSKSVSDDYLSTVGADDESYQVQLINLAERLPRTRGDAP